MPKTAEIDEELAAALKQAKSKRMYFAVVVKGAADGALIVSKQKVPPTAIAEAKKKCGGSAVIKGACFVEDGKHVFEVAKEPPATLANALKLIARRDSGLTIHPICRVGGAADLLEEEEEEAHCSDGFESCDGPADGYRQARGNGEGRRSTDFGERSASRGRQVRRGSENLGASQCRRFERGR